MTTSPDTINGFFQEASRWLGISENWESWSVPAIKGALATAIGWMLMGNEGAVIGGGLSALHDMYTIMTNSLEEPSATPETPTAKSSPAPGVAR